MATTSNYLVTMGLRWTSLMILLLFWVFPAVSEDPVPGRLDQLFAQSIAPAPPPQKIPPADPKSPSVNQVFLFSGNTFNLPTATFYLLLFDFPKAVLIESKAELLAVDSKFFYYRDLRFETEWAFAKDPVNNFACHAVWSRRRGETEWRLRSNEATMAIFSSTRLQSKGK